MDIFVDLGFPLVVSPIVLVIFAVFTSDTVVCII